MTDGKRPNGKRGGGWITPSKRLAIYLRDRFTCGYCRRDLHTVKPHEITLDHLEPRVRGGSNDHTNLLTTCNKCNSRRKDRPWREFATLYSVCSVAVIEYQRQLPLPLLLAESMKRKGNGERELERLRAIAGPSGHRFTETAH